MSLDIGSMVKHTDRSARQWGGLAIGLVFTAIGAWLFLSGSSRMSGAVIGVVGIAIAIGQLVWILRSRANARGQQEGHDD